MTELELLNAPTPEQRLENLKTLLAAETEAPTPLPQYANNHIHTTYSFSPYSPTAAVWFARKAGLTTAGIMDHDSLGGAEEFRQAAELAGIGATCGFEARISFAGTPFESVKLNNPDQPGVAYMTFHSIRREHFARAQALLAPRRELRNQRSRAITHALCRHTGLDLDFDRDVLPISQYDHGGTVTERHILFALAGKMPGGENLDERYRILGQLKSQLLPEVFVPAQEELMTLKEAVELAKELDAYLCYAYLGDVTQSPTGDKKAAKYEDSFIDQLIPFLKAQGVEAVTFMPSRNTPQQLKRVMDLCREQGMRQISGEDVNSPSQSFICRELAQAEYAHLVDAAWELVEREK